MSSDVSISSGMRTNLLQLQKTNKQIETVQERLATGNKINSALDGSNAYFQAKDNSSRASELDSLKSGMGQAISTIQAADEGITAIEDLIEQARSLTTSAYSNLGTDAASIATRKSLAEQFNTIKEQIDKIAGDSGYQGKNLLSGNGLSLDSTSSSREDVNAITGLSNSKVTNVTSTDTYSVKVSGTGAISADLADIADAEDSRGITSLKVSGTLSASAGNFSDISIEMRGNTGRERTVVVTENGESRTFKFFDNTQSATASTTTAATTSSAQVSEVTISGSFEVGDTVTATLNGQSFSYEVTEEDLNDGTTDYTPEERQQNIATKLQAVVEAGVGASGSNRFTIGAATDGSFSVTSNITTGTGTSFTVGASATNAEEKAISVTFSSGTVVSFTVDRDALEGLETAANGTSTIEKNVDITVSATNLNGVTVERSGTNARGDSKLSDGENSLVFDSGTVRVTVDAATIKAAASGQSSSNLTTVQRSDANTENDLSVQFNSDNSSNITVYSSNVGTDGQGLRIDYAQNDFLDRSDIDAAVSSLDYAASKLESTSQSLSTNLSVVQAREDFSTEFANVLTEGASKLVGADDNEESANLLTLQTRQQLSTISMSIANQTQQAILRLF